MMRFSKVAATLALGAAAVALSACAESINTTVSRYQAMPAPQGQTFFVVPDGGMARNGGLEFQHYAGLVAQQLEAHGYRPAAGAQGANMIVQLGYGVDRGQVRYTSSGYGGFWGYPYGARWGWGGRYLWGWNAPLWDDGLDSYIEYQGQVEVHIRQSGTNAPLFDGRAIARSYTDRLDVVVPSLLDAMFSGFPGQNGETLKITIPQRQRV